MFLVLSSTSVPRTIVLLKKLKPLKKPLFQKRRWSCDSCQEKRQLPKSTARFPAKKRWHSLSPRRVVLDSPPLSQSLCERTDGRTYLRTDGHVTITSQPKFLGSIGYKICLATELRWRALPAGSAISTSQEPIVPVESFRFGIFSSRKVPIVFLVRNFILAWGRSLVNL